MGTRLIWATLALATVVAVAARPGEAQDDAAARIADLERRVADLEAKQSGPFTLRCLDGSITADVSAVDFSSFAPAVGQAMLSHPNAVMISWNSTAQFPLAGAIFLNCS